MPTPPDDILLNKAAIIERCIRRIAEESRACPRYDAAHFNKHPSRGRWAGVLFCPAPVAIMLGDNASRRAYRSRCVNRSRPK